MSSNAQFQKITMLPSRKIFCFAPPSLPPSGNSSLFPYIASNIFFGPPRPRNLWGRNGFFSGTTGTQHVFVPSGANVPADFNFQSNCGNKVLHVSNNPIDFNSLFSETISTFFFYFFYFFFLQALITTEVFSGGNCRIEFHVKPF